jgi:exopolysaccharide biosynthesis polyprenyl glycosylphosphotransferase
MLNRRRHGIRVFGYFVAELLVLTGAFFAGYYLRRLPCFATWEQSVDSLSAYLWLLPATLGIWSVLLWFSNTYDGFRTRSLRMHGAIAAVTSVIAVLAVFALLTILKRYNVNRSLIAFQGGCAFVFIFATRAVSSVFLSHYTEKGYDRHYVLIGGAAAEALSLAELLEGLPGRVYQVRGLLSEGTPAAEETAGRWKVLGRYEDIPELAKQFPVDEVYLLPGGDRIDPFRPLIEKCEAMGVTVHLRLTAFEKLLSRVDLHTMGQSEYLMFSTAPRDLVGLGLKRTIDLATSIFMLLVLSPVLLLVALLVKLTSRGPVIFRQERAGMSGRVFTLYKFRTMREGAEQERAALESKNELDGPAFKIKEDPRITGLGRILRKTSIDELPQLWNVLKGDMSLVGPRPLPVYEVEKFESWQRRRMTMRPGITCLWQIMGRNRVTNFDEWMRLDLEYVDRWSLGLDVRILLKTVPAVVGGRGAY